MSGFSVGTKTTSLAYNELFLCRLYTYHLARVTPITTTAYKSFVTTNK